MEAGAWLDTALVVNMGCRCSEAVTGTKASREAWRRHKEHVELTMPSSLHSKLASVTSSLMAAAHNENASRSVESTYSRADA